MFKNNCLEVVLDKKFYRDSSEKISKALKDLITSINRKTESYYNYVLRLAKQRIERRRRQLQASKPKSIAYEDFQQGIC